jgi:hypothetical protein
MSDYLGNLIARTVSPAVAVRPQLPSLFEPAPAAREAKSEPEFEQENFVEQLPVTQPSETLAPIPLSIPTPRQSVFREPEQTVPEISRPRKILGTSQESERARPPTSILHQSTPREPSRIFSRKRDGKPSPEPDPPVQPRTFPWAAPTLREDKPSNSTRRRSDVIKSPLPDVIASPPHEVSAREETGPSQPSVASKPAVVREPREHELPTRSEVQAILPMIRPERELPARSGVQPVVSKIRSLPPIAPLPPASATVLPAINVTIGRVEVRAVPPPAQQRRKPKAAAVLSLEEYLRQRASGGSR